MPTPPSASLSASPAIATIVKPVSAAPLVIALMLGGCATPSPETAKPPQPQASPATAATATSPMPSAPAAPPTSPVAEADDAGPEQRNYLGAPTLLLTGQDQWGEYYSALAKLTYTYDNSGRLILATDHEPTIDGNTPEEKDTTCAEHGAGMNQRTTWFPDTGFFVRGGTLRAVRKPGNTAMPLLPLGVSERVYMTVIGKDARKTEMVYIPCVGSQRVTVGHRTQQFVPLGSTLEISETSGRRLQLTLPTSPTPFVLLRYRSGALIPSPMRIVLATVDTQRKRLVLQFQSTAFVKPAIRVIEWRALVDADQTGEGETVERHRERREATKADLAKCPAPFHPPEPCATESRVPDRRIFFAK